MDKTPTTSQQQSLAVHKIYTKGCLFESATFTSSLLKSLPQVVIDLKVHLDFSQREDKMYEAILSLDLTGKHEGNLLWRVQVQQAGLYTLQNFTEEHSKRILNGFCMNQLYPYACSEVNHLVTQGGFLPIALAPMNFETLYQENLKQQEQQEKETAIEH